MEPVIVKFIYRCSRCAWQGNKTLDEIEAHYQDHEIETESILNFEKERRS
jgi:hypothetical protein